MPVFTKALCFMIVPVFLLSVLAVPALRGESETQDGVPLDKDSWRTFREGSASYTAPEGFEVHDPFTTGTPHSDLTWSMSWPRKNAHVALLTSGAGAFQIFLHRGDAEQLSGIAREALDYYEGNVMVEQSPEAVWKTAEGTPFTWRTVRYRPGLVASRDSTFLLGHATRGEQSLLVNAGGLTADFDLARIRAVVESVRLGN